MSGEIEVNNHYNGSDQLIDPQDQFIEMRHIIVEGKRSWKMKLYLPD